MLPGLSAPASATTSLRRPRRSLGYRLSRGFGGLVAWLAIVVAVFVALFPFFWILRTAFTPTPEAFSLRPTLLPASLTFEHIVRVIVSPTLPFGRYFLNSAIVSLGTTLLVLIA